MLNRSYLNRLRSRLRGKGGVPTTRIIALGFLIAIIVGTALLLLPFCRREAGSAGFMEALFTSCTSVCVTGLSITDISSYWSFGGQLIILILIQLGGLGIVAFTTGVMLLIGRRVTLRDRLIIESAFNLSTLQGLVNFLKRIFKGTFIIELIGVCCYSVVFIPRLGFPKGIWASIFASVSAFCNAGMDVIGSNSLASYVDHVWINVVTIVLITLGGIGFIVWWDVLRVIRMVRSGKCLPRRALHRLTLHSKLSLSTSAILLMGGALAILLLEYNNPETLGKLSFGNKVMASFFQSVTLRTAGFYTVSQAGLREPTAVFSLLLMLVGGCSVGTAGGIKTTTFALLLLSALSTAQGRDDATAFGRTIPFSTLRKASAVAIISFFAAFTMSLLLCVISGASFTDCAYEIFSAVNTVGVTRDLTTTLGVGGQLLVIFCMYIGRIGPISLAITFTAKKKNPGSLIVYAKEDVTVG